MNTLTELDGTLTELRAACNKAIVISNDLVEDYFSS